MDKAEYEGAVKDAESYARQNGDSAFHVMARALLAANKVVEAARLFLIVEEALIGVSGSCTALNAALRELDQDKS